MRDSKRKTSAAVWLSDSCGTEREYQKSDVPSHFFYDQRHKEPGLSHRSEVIQREGMGNIAFARRRTY